MRRRLNWVCTVCQLPVQGSPVFNGLKTGNVVFLYFHVSTCLVVVIIVIVVIAAAATTVAVVVVVVVVVVVDC